LSTTLDLIDRRIRAAVLKDNSTRPIVSQARVDGDPQARGVMPVETYHYSIRRGDVFKPVVEILVSERSGHYTLGLLGDYENPIHEALKNDKAQWGSGQWRSNELDAPLGALEAYIIERLHAT
jgi:hypothetical protein